MINLRSSDRDLGAAVCTVTWLFSQFGGYFVSAKAGYTLNPQDILLASSLPLVSGASLTGVRYFEDKDSLREAGTLGAIITGYNYGVNALCFSGGLVARLLG